MVTSSLWDNIDRGDSSASSFNVTGLDLDTSHISKPNELRSSPKSPRLVIPQESQQGRSVKRRSWFDWTNDFEDDDSRVNDLPHTTHTKQDLGQRRKSMEDENLQEIKNRFNQKESTVPSSFIHNPFLILAQLDDEGIPAKEFEKISRRRSMEREIRPKSLSGSLKRSTRDLAKFVRQVSNTGLDEELHVPFPSQRRECNRRRSAW